MVGRMTEHGEGVEGTALGPGNIPQELVLFIPLIDLLPFEAFHLPALPAENRRVDACMQVVFPDPDGRLLRVDYPQMKKGADHFTEVAAAALFPVNPDSHPLIPVA